MTSMITEISENESLLKNELVLNKMELFHITSFSLSPESPQN